MRRGNPVLRFRTVQAASTGLAWLAGGFCILLASFWMSACGQQAQNASRPQIEIAGQTMGTTYSVKVVAPDKTLDAARLKADLDAELQRVNQAMSTYLDDSELSRFNQAEPDAWQPVSAMLMTVLTEAGRVFRISGGAFDPSVGPLVNLWGFGPEMKLDFPSDEEIRQAREEVGFAAIELDAGNSAVRKRHAMYIDLSAIAKGYGVDRASALLAAQGLQDHLVEIGGELRASGRNADSQPWRIAVEKPAAGERAIHGLLKLENGMSMATSGDYRNFFEKDGQRYQHTIDPNTGYPVPHSLVSVTVLAEQCMTADAMATAFMVLGADKGLALAEREHLAVWFIEEKNGKLVDHLSSKMQSYRLH